MTEGFRPETGHPETDADLRRVLDKLVSLHDGDRGVLDVAAYGSGALPALRLLLFKREASGLYQPQCHVVEALAALVDGCLNPPEFGDMGSAAVAGSD